MLSCKEASQIISQSLDRQLTRRESIALKFHLLICKYCNRFNQQLQTIRVALKLAGSKIENDDTIKMPTDARKRLMQSIESSND